MCEVASEGVLHRDLAVRNVLVAGMDPVHVKVEGREGMGGRKARGGRGEGRGRGRGGVGEEHGAPREVYTPSTLGHQCCTHGTALPPAQQVSDFGLARLPGSPPMASSPSHGPSPCVPVYLCRCLTLAWPDS